MTEITINVSQYINDKINLNAKKYADGMTGKSQSIDYYGKNRNAGDPEKTYWDTFNGKKGEYFASIILNKKFGFPYLEPDCSILPGRQKNWDPDLPYNNNHPTLPNVAVKTCSNSTYHYCNDYSWTFQYSNNNGIGGQDTLLDSTDDNYYIALMHVPKPKENIGILMVFAPWTKVSPYLKDPLSQRLVGLKQCLYFEDLQQNIEELIPNNLNQWSLLNVT